MPSYDIFYLDLDDRAESKVTAECADEREAKILAHALKEKGRKRITVWDAADRHLVYQRPQERCAEKAGPTGDAGWVPAFG